jgi:hypothetical protein
VVAGARTGAGLCMRGDCERKNSTPSARMSGRTPVYVLCFPRMRLHSTAVLTPARLHPHKHITRLHRAHATRPCGGTAHAPPLLRRIATCATPDLFLQHLDQTLSKQLKTLESRCKHMQCPGETLEIYMQNICNIQINTLATYV